MGFNPSSSHASGVSDPIVFGTPGDLVQLGNGGLFLGNANASVQVQDATTSVFTAQVAGALGEVILGPNITAAPPDLDLVASQVALWLDATIGATKLMVKAKDSGGTVRTAAIALV